MLRADAASVAQSTCQPSSAILPDDTITFDGKEVPLGRYYDDVPIIYRTALNTAYPGLVPPREEVLNFDGSPPVATKFVIPCSYIATQLDMDADEFKIWLYDRMEHVDSMEGLTYTTDPVNKFMFTAQAAIAMLEVETSTRYKARAAELARHIRARFFGVDPVSKQSARDLTPSGKRLERLLSEPVPIRKKYGAYDTPTTAWNIDARVAAWPASGSKQSLNAYLGLSWESYCRIEQEAEAYRQLVAAGEGAADAAAAAPPYPSQPWELTGTRVESITQAQALAIVSEVYSEPIEDPDAPIQIDVLPGTQFPVDARSLHADLQVGRFFANWIKDRIEKFKLVKGVDYIALPNSAKQKMRSGEQTGRGETAAPSNTVSPSSPPASWRRT